MFVGDDLKGSCMQYRVRARWWWRRKKAQPEQKIVLKWREKKRTNGKHNYVHPLQKCGLVFK